MHKLRNYCAVVSTEDKELFLNLVSRFGRESGVYLNNRLNSITEHNGVATYHTYLSDDELLIVKLRCPGDYSRINTSYVDLNG